MISGTRFRLNLQINRQMRLAQDIARTQAEIAMGKRILAPSDDPTGAARVAELNRTQADEATWLKNIETASMLAARADTTLKSVTIGLDRAKELMLAAATGTMSAENRVVIAEELRGIAEEIAALRQARDPRGEPLFRTNGELEIPVDAGVRISPVLARDAVFDAPVDVVATIQAAAIAAVEPDAATRSAAIRTSLDQIDAASDQIGTAHAEQGVRAGRLEKLHERLTASDLQLEEQKAVIEGTDVPEAIARIQSRQLSLDAAQAIFARMNQRSLFDLFR